MKIDEFASVHGIKLTEAQATGFMFGRRSGKTFMSYLHLVYRLYTSKEKILTVTIDDVDLDTSLVLHPPRASRVLWLKRFHDFIDQFFPDIVCEHRTVYKMTLSVKTTDTETLYKTLKSLR